MTNMLTLGLLALSLFSSVGCGEAPAATSESATSRAPLAQPALSRSGKHVRKQASYHTTLVENANGQRFTDGAAILDVYYGEGGSARSRLNVVAWNDDGEAWRTSLELPEAALGEGETTTDLGVRTGHQMRIERAHRDGSLVAQSEQARLTLRREALAGKRPVYHAQLDTDSSETSVKLRTEYQLACHVPPEMIGLPAKQGQQTPPGSSGQVLVQDELHQSPFCQRFAALR